MPLNICESDSVAKTLHGWIETHMSKRGHVILAYYYDLFVCVMSFTRADAREHADVLCIAGNAEQARGMQNRCRH